MSLDSVLELVVNVSRAEEFAKKGSSKSKKWLRWYVRGAKGKGKRFLCEIKALQGICELVSCEATRHVAHNRVCLKQNILNGLFGRNTPKNALNEAKAGRVVVQGSRNVGGRRIRSMEQGYLFSRFYVQCAYSSLPEMHPGPPRGLFP